MRLTSLIQASDSTVSHNVKISKKALFMFGDLPPLTNFSQATFPPGAIAYAHAHPDMLEVFFIQSGHAAITVEGNEYDLPTGSCIAIEPNETHELRNASSTETMVVTYFGIQMATDMGKR